MQYRGGALHLFARDIEMRHGTDALWGRSVHPDAFVAEPGNKGGGSSKFRIDFEDHDVGVNHLRVESQAGRETHGLSENASVGMVIGEAVDMVLQSVKRTGGDDAGLTHASAECFAVTAGSTDEVCWTTKRRADRGPQPLRKADADGVEVTGPIGGGNTRGDHSVEEAHSIKVPRRPLSAAQPQISATES